jgi:hypothetical protein
LLNSTAVLMPTNLVRCLGAILLLFSGLKLFSVRQRRGLFD